MIAFGCSGTGGAGGTDTLLFCGGSWGFVFSADGKATGGGGGGTSSSVTATGAGGGGGAFSFFVCALPITVIKLIKATVKNNLFI
ncbi:hypothetical protein SY85_15100 [Flavisolibacter tropicus]|uniref:Uncharacterized protein n=1 Tax=Flavisolibacter tropicus TaxID=1492898 RepID=A0A172TXB5_9BACT|nr:hypothetical protein SY85_15100 [Flavisolibacter tropicus]